MDRYRNARSHSHYGRKPPPPMPRGSRPSDEMYGSPRREKPGHSQQRKAPQSPHKRPSQQNPPRRRISKRNINRSVTAVAGVFFIFVIVYLLSSVYTFLMTPHVATEVIKTGSIDLPRVLSGIVVRDEHVYTAERDGRVMFNVGEYARVKPDTQVCSIQDVESVEDINENLASIEEQLAQLQQTRKDISPADPAIQRINGQIKNIVDGRLNHFIDLSIPDIYTLKNDLSQRIESRNQMIVDENWSVKNDLGLQQQQLISRLGTFEKGIVPGVGGLVVPVIDGMEETLTFETMKELSREQTLMTVDYNQLNPLKEVKTGDPVFKIVASNEWYVAAYVPNELLEDVTEGAHSTIYVESLKNAEEFQPVSAELSLINPGYSESFVLYKITKNIIDYMNTRSVRFKTTDSVHTGLKISATAITTHDFYPVPLNYIHSEGNSRFILKKNAEGNTQTQVSVTWSDDAYSYIWVRLGQVAQGDILFGNKEGLPEYTVTEAVTEQGVYRVNNGVAEFRHIILDDNTSSASGYVVLDTGLSQGIRTYDYIVTDAAGIEDGQIIK